MFKACLPERPRFLNSSSISWKSGTCYPKWRYPLCGGSHQIQQLCLLELCCKMTLWGQWDSTERPVNCLDDPLQLQSVCQQPSVGTCRQSSRQSGEPMGVSFQEGTRCYLLNANVYGCLLAELKTLLPTQSLSRTFHDFPEATVPSLCICKFLILEHDATSF